VGPDSVGLGVGSIGVGVGSEGVMAAWVALTSGFIVGAAVGNALDTIGM